MDLLLLGHEGGTVYNGPLRLTTPYFLSIGLGKYGGNITQESLQEFLSSPDGSIPFLDGQASHPFLFLLLVSARPECLADTMSGI